MKNQRLDAINALRSKEDADWWRAIEDLAPDLDDCLVIVDESSALPGGAPQSLTVFRGRDPARTELFALIARQGRRVLVGRTDRLDCNRASLPLADYDPLWDQVVTLIVTQRYRPLGDRLDLWVVTRRHRPDTTETPESLVYHGLVWVDPDGRPHLDPASDDGQPEQPGQWSAQSARGLPPWQLRDGFGFAPGVDDFPRWDPQGFAAHQDGCRLAIRGERTVCLATCDGLALASPDEPRWLMPPLYLREPVCALAVVDSAASPGGAQTRVRGVAGCEDGRIVAFRQGHDGLQDGLETEWIQTFRAPSVVFAPVGPFQADAWPDLLVGFADDRLARLRYVAKAIRNQWERCWHHLFGTDRVDGPIAWLERQDGPGLSPGRRYAIWIRVLETVVDAVGEASPAQRQHWLNTIPGLFPSGAGEARTPGALFALIRALRRAAYRDAAGLETGGHFLPDLMLRIYRTRLDVTDRDRIDEIVRGIPWPDSAQSSPVAELRARARRTLVSVSGEPLPDPHDQDEQAHRAAVELECWANTFLSTDIRSFPREEPGRALVGIAGLRLGGMGICVAIARHDGVAFHALDAGGRLSHDPPGIFDARGDTLRTLAIVPTATADRLLAISHSGHLFLIDPEQPNGAIRRPVRDWAGAGCLAAACPAAAGGARGSFLAVIVNAPAGARLTPCRIDGDTIEIGAGQPLGLPEVGALDLVTDGDAGYRLLVGMARPGPARIYRLDRLGQIQGRRWLRVLESGARAVGLSGPFAMTGEQNGLVSCAEVKTLDDLPGPCWFARVDGAVRGIAQVQVDGTSHVLVGAESGEMCLLRVRDGRRIWSRRLADPIRRLYIVQNDPSLALVWARGNLLALFKSVSPALAQKALERASDHLAPLAAPPYTGLNAASVTAFHRLLVERESPRSVLDHERDPDTRVLLLRYLAQYRERAEGPAETLDGVSPRELALLMSNLPTAAAGWDEAIRAQLRRMPAAEDPGQRAPGEAAVAVYLRRLAGQSLDLERVIADSPIAEPYLGSSALVRYSFARLLADAVRRALRAETAGSDRPFRLLLRYLLRLPSPDLAMALEQVCSYESVLQQGFRDLAHLLRELREGAALSADPMVRVSQRLNAADWDATDGWVGLPLPLLGLPLGVAVHGYKDWADWRREGLKALRSAADACIAVKKAGAAPYLLQQRAHRDLLNAPPVAADSEALEVRIRTVEAALRHLQTRRHVEPQHEAAADPWSPYSEGLLTAARVAMTRMLQDEHGHLLQLVRPRLILERQHRDENNRLVLNLELHAEGMRQLYYVKIHVDASGEGGLRGPGVTRLEKPLEHLSYPGQFPVDPVRLEGYVAPDQADIKVRVTLEDSLGNRVVEDWRFPLNAPLGDESGWLTLPGSLPGIYRTFIDALRRSRAPVTLAVLDADLGGEQLIRDWDAAPLGPRVDLDAALHDTGRGRRYAQGRLTVQLIEQTIESGTALRRPDGPLLVAPCHELIQRLDGGETPGGLEEWLGRLRRRLMATPLIILVSSHDAARLRTLGLGPIPELAAHRDLLETSDAPGADSRQRSSWAEMIDLATHHIKGRGDDPQRAVEALGGDPRLLLRWLRTAQRHPRSGPVLWTQFLSEPEQRNLLRDELRALPAYDLINLLLGSLAVTQVDRLKVVPGQVAAADQCSNVGKAQSKRLQAAGSPFTVASLARIGEDLVPPNRLAVEGIGGPVTTLAPRTLLALARHRGHERRDPSLRRLHRLGLGRLLAGIFRTGSPYRERIRELYDEHSGQPEASRDAAVYAAIVGAERHLTDVVAPEELAKLPPGTLNDLLPSVAGADLSRLRGLATLWGRDPDVDEVHRTIKEVFAPGHVTPLPHVPKRWDAPLLALRLTCFGLWDANSNARNSEADGYPESHILWVPKGNRSGIGVISNAQKEAQGAANRVSEPSSGVRRATTRPLGNRPRVLLLGPGADALAPDPERRVAVLRLADAVQAAWEGDLAEGLHRKARVQLGLAAYSPFQTSGALPPGSPLFKGRQRELQFIRTHVRRASILIVGGRRVGKTSLLNQVLHWARGEPDLQPLYLEMQGIRTRAEFLSGLAGIATDTALGPETHEALARMGSAPDARTAMRDLAAAIRAQGKTPLFLLNEVDYLFEQDPALVETWRGMNDEGLARFVTVGYAVIGRLSTLGGPQSPFFHFTAGTDFGGKAIALGALSVDGAAQILDLLESNDLGLRWVDQGQKDAAYAALLNRSHRIPWVLQRYGQLLVERMDELRSDRIGFEDVERLFANEGNVVWKYIQEIDYRRLGYGDNSRSRIGLWLILYSLARSRYFLGGGGAPIRDARLSERSGLDLGFSVDEARTIVVDTLKGLLVDREYQAFERWFGALDLHEAFRLLTLTLTLEPDPDQADRYGFLLHIVPLELKHRFGSQDSTLDGLIVDQAVQLVDAANQEDV